MGIEMGRFYDDLLDSVSIEHRDLDVEEVLVGHHWTLVRTEKTGLAYTYRLPHSPHPQGAGTLTPKRAWELAGYIKSWNLLEASIGLATLNSLCDLEGEDTNAHEYALARANGRKVAVVGHFPFLQKMKEISKALWVMELNPQEGDLPASAAEEFLPRADITLITGTSIINKTLPRLLELSRGSETILLGPSVPLTTALFDYGVDVLGGIRVTDGPFLRRCVSEGARNLFQFNTGLQLVMVRSGTKRASR